MVKIFLREKRELVRGSGFRESWRPLPQPCSRSAAIITTIVTIATIATIVTIANIVIASNLCVTAQSYCEFFDRVCPSMRALCTVVSIRAEINMGKHKPTTTWERLRESNVVARLRVVQLVSVFTSFSITKNPWCIVMCLVHYLVQLMVHARGSM